LGLGAAFGAGLGAAFGEVPDALDDVDLADRDGAEDDFCFEGAAFTVVLLEDPAVLTEGEGAAGCTTGATGATGATGRVLGAASAADGFAAPGTAATAWLDSAARAASACADTANPAAPMAVAAVAPTMIDVPIRAASRADLSRSTARRLRS